MNKVPPLIRPPLIAPPKKSVLVPFGLVLIMVGVLAPVPLTQAARAMPPGTLRAVTFLSTDAFRLCFFAGVGAIIIGLRRNRLAKQQPPETLL